jgi:hypothetical protein
MNEHDRSRLPPECESGNQQRVHTVRDLLMIPPHLFQVNALENFCDVTAFLDQHGCAAQFVTALFYEQRVFHEHFFADAQFAFGILEAGSHD